MERLQLDLESDVMRANDILNSKVGHVHAGVVNFLQLLSVIPRCRVTVLLRLGSSADHLARAEDQCCRLRLSNTHDGCRKSFRFVLHVSSLKTNLVKIQLCSQFCGGDNILQGGHVVLFYRYYRRANHVGIRYRVVAGLVPDVMVLVWMLGLRHWVLIRGPVLRSNELICVVSR